MKTFPKFLRVLPNFYGLSFYDIGGLMITLYVTTFLNLNPFVTLLITLTGILTTKFVQRRFDFIGWMVPRKITIRRNL